MWINPETKQVFKTHSEIRGAFPTTSFPASMSESDIEFVGLRVLTIEPYPEVDHTFNVSEGEPYEQDNLWKKGWVVTPATPEEISERLKAMVPESITKRQGRQQMILMGIIDQVELAISSIEDPIERALTQSFWDDSTQYERNHPQMISLSQAIGLSEQDLDQAFIAASQL